MVGVQNRKKTPQCSKIVLFFFLRYSSRFLGKSGKLTLNGSLEDNPSSKNRILGVLRVLENVEQSNF